MTTNWWQDLFSQYILLFELELLHCSKNEITFIVLQLSTFVRAFSTLGFEPF